MTVVSAVPTVASYTTYVPPQTQPYVVPSHNTIPVFCHGPYLPFQTKDSQPIPYYTIYYVNNVPHACYSHQPDVLYPLQYVAPELNNQNTSSQEDRFLPELVAGMGTVVNQVLEQNVESLENYVQGMEQQAVTNLETEVKKNCLSFCA